MLASLLHICRSWSDRSAITLRYPRKPDPCGSAAVFVLPSRSLAWGTFRRGPASPANATGLINKGGGEIAQFIFGQPLGY